YAAGRDMKRFPVGTPIAVVPLPSNALGAIQCIANPRAKTVTCDAPAATPSGLRPLIMGGQHQYVNLASSNVSSVESGGMFDFTFDVTVENLIPQPIGTTDGTTADVDSVRVFFYIPPTATAGSGMIEVTDTSGVGTFLATNQEYYQYAAPLDSGVVSAPRSWHFKMPNTVQTFAFTVFVAGAVQFPEGW